MQVAHFEPETIHLHGEAIFPRIFLNLPRHSVADEYEQLLCTARENLLKEKDETVSNLPASAVSEDDEANARSMSPVSLFSLIVQY